MMTGWLSENWVSLILLLVVAVILFFLVRGKIRQRKQGKCGCGCANCSGCRTHQKGGKV